MLSCFGSGRLDVDQNGPAKEWYTGRSYMEVARHGSHVASRSAGEQEMISWIVRLLMIAAGAVTGWLVAEDAPNFGVIQMMVALVLLTLIVAVLAFWPSDWTARLN